MSSRVVLALILSVGLVDCYVESLWPKAEAALRRRAAFEMSCPADQLQIVPLTSETAIEDDNFTNAPKTVGVSGCDKKGTYVYVPDKGYVLNSATEAIIAPAPVHGPSIGPSMGGAPPPPPPK